MSYEWMAIEKLKELWKEKVDAGKIALENLQFHEAADLEAEAREIMDEIDRRESGEGSVSAPGK